MKKQKNYYKKLWIISIFVLGLGISIAYATGITKYINHSVSTGTGANGSKIEFSVASDGNNFATYYVNSGNNSSIIGNYFKGYYYDSVYGFFKLNWDSPGSPKNVRIVNSTDKCNGYGYKLGGYAYSENFGFVDFSYDNNHFVYYCLEDKKLHGYAYLENVGFQNFEGIGFQIALNVINDTTTVESDEFVNDNTEITNPNYENDLKTIEGNIQHIKDTDGSVFYIIK